MIVTIRKFEAKDIENKVRWINTPEVNEYLHYDLPLTVEGTAAWYARTADRTDRYDAVIEADGVPCGLIGLLSIDQKNKKAEYYVALGELSYLRHHVAARATELLLEYAFGELLLNRVYLFTETENAAAQRLIERVGFVKEGCLTDDLFSRGRYVSRFVYGIRAENFCRRNLS